MSATSRNQVFSAVHTVGALLPADMLQRIAESKDVPGSGPADYGVIGKRSVRDDAERHWDYLKAAWTELRDHLPAAPDVAVPADPTGHAIRQWIEPLLAELGFGRLASIGAGIPADDGSKTFAISHRWNHVPIHITAWNLPLDGHPGSPGATRPQSLVQECLNRTETHLWAILTNGRQLRLLRDSNALATTSYVEFDLEAIFDGELFSEFVLLYLLLHVSRFAVAEGAPPSGCWLEKWRLEAIDSGVRALDHLRDGVQKAITALGTGFLKHPANAALSKNLDVDAFHAALLRLAYQLIFWFVIEDRDLLHDPDAPVETRRPYADYFSSDRLRRHAMRRRGTSHTDLYQAVRVVLDALGRVGGRPALGLPGLGGIFDDPADAPLAGLSLANADLLEAIRHLCRVRDASSARWRQVDYRNIGSEELGSIYESLLELIPKHDDCTFTFELINRLGNDRKKTGSYYTPSSLIETLLDSTLDPVIDDAQKRGEQNATAAGEPDPTGSVVAELLSLTVCDPACGSGHFLVAAARRIAKRVAAVREGNPEPTLDTVRHALHEVIGRCVYGVDLNPMAVELAKVSLWLEAMEPGTALGFLDAHIKRGNALIGATPALLRQGIPDKAFKPVEGDDPAIARSWARQNEQERAGQGSLFDVSTEPKVSNTTFAASLRAIAEAPEHGLEDVRRKASDYEQWQGETSYRQARRVADAWCAAFMWHKAADAPPPVTEDVFRAMQDPEASAAEKATYEEIERLRREYRFFHWHLEFPEIFAVSDTPDAGLNRDTDSGNGWTGGFSCVLGNPPWDKVDFEDKKYFSVVEPSIAAISGLARRNRIAQWTMDYPEAGAHYKAARRKVKSTFLFAGSSGAFPLCSRGLSLKGVTMLQTDHLFAERFTSIASPTGRYGCIIPTTIATGAGAQYLFRSFASRGAIASLYDFENSKPVFVGVHASYKFCLLSLTGRNQREPVASFAFFLLGTEDLDSKERVFNLSPEEIALISPNTGNLPIFRTRRDADLTTAIYRRLPVLHRDAGPQGNPWKVTFMPTPFHMTDDSDLFRTRERLQREGWALSGNTFTRGQERMLPLYEGKMVHHFDHRWNSYTGTGNEDRRRLSLAEKVNASTLPDPRYWVAEEGLIETKRNGRTVMVPGVQHRLTEADWNRKWLCGWRDVCRATDERTAIAAFIPRTAVGHKFPLMLPAVSSTLTAGLIAAQSSLVFDYVSRQKIGSTSMGLFIWKQLPVPSPEMMNIHTSFITPRVLELVYTSYDMAPLAVDLGNRLDAAPFRWDEDRRAQIRAELDAYFFHLYGVPRDDADYIMETFQTENGGLKNNDIARFGTYRTKDLVLAEYDRMAAANVGLESPLIDGENYVSPLVPPPGNGPRHTAQPVTQVQANGEGF
jgi:hypothetical protein